MQADLSWFAPLPKQLGFIHSPVRESVYAGGFGSGKTLSGGFRALIAAIEHPGTVGLVGRQSYGALRDNTQKVILEGDDKSPIIPPELVASRSEKGGTSVTLHNGSQVLFRSFQDWNEHKLLGPNYGFVYIDELTECTERVWLAFLSRLRHPAGPEQAWGTTNPNGHDWVWRRFHSDSGQAEADSLLVHAPTEENIHLSPTYVAWLRSQPSEWQKRFVDASFDTAAGMIWDEWQRAIHVVERVDLPYDWRRFESLDHGRRNPTAYLQWIVDPEGFCLVADEYYSPGLVSQHAAAVAVKRGVRTWGPVIADRGVFTADAYGNTPAAEYGKHSITMLAADMDVSAGLLRVSELLLRRPERAFPSWHPWAGTLGPDGRGSPLLFVSEDCPALIGEIPMYVWRDLSPTLEERQNQPEEPRKLNDHACDALRYGAMSRPRPYEPPGTDVREKSEVLLAPELSAGIRERTF